MACLVDIVGFTGLTEQHAARGPEGAEQLRGVIDAHFRAVVEAFDAHGGEVAAFVGDAMLVTFCDARLGGPEPAARAAWSAAHAVQALVERGAPGVLPQRVSLSSGTLTAWALATPREGRGVYALGGEAVLGLAAPHRLARPGDVVATEAFARALGVPGHRRGPGVVCLSGLGVPPAAEREPGGAVARPVAVDALALEAWLPRVVRERHGAGQDAWLNEFRVATIVFAEVPVAGDGPEAMSSAAGPLLGALEEFDGDSLGLVVDEKGTTLVGAFGLPGRARGDDAVRAVRAALAMGVAAGVATGRIYAGLLGAPSRQDYGGVGQPMNLAARLLGAASGGVLVDENTARGLAGRLPVVAVPPLSLKGWANPVRAFRALAGQAEPVAVVGTGRDAERARLLAAHARGAGALRHLVVGEPGMGKSVLLAQVAAEARARGALVWRAEAGAVERNTPYFAWRPVLGALVGDSSLDEVLGLLGPDLAPLASLLNGTWPLEAPSAPLAAQVESAARAGAVRELVVALMVALGPGPGGRALLVVDDAHWLDGASGHLLREVGQRLPRLDLLVGARTDLAGPQGESALGLPLEQLELGPMDDDDVARLVASALGAPASPGLVELVRTRGAGHPFSCEQLALALRDAGAARLQGGSWVLEGDGAALTLPLHVEGLVTSRLDALPPSAQLTAKVASVVGRSFPGQAVADVYPREADPQQVPGALLALERSAIVGREAPSVGERRTVPDLGAWAFRHAITHEVAYSLLPFAQRRLLHLHVGEWFRARAAGDPDWSILAWHFERAAAVDQALEALENAAAVAMQQHANVDAQQLLGRAVALGEAAVVPSRAARWFSMLGTVSLRLVAYDTAKMHFRAALTKLGLPVPAGRGRLLLDLGWACFRLGARALVRRGPSGNIAERARMRAAAEAHQGLAESAYFSLELPELLHANVHAIVCAERSGEARELAHAYGSGAIGAGVGGLHRLADHWRDAAADEAARSGHAPTVAYVHLLGGVYANAMGRLVDGRARSRASALGFATLRDRFREATARYAVAFGCFGLGDFEGATAAAVAARRVTPREGSLQLRAWDAALEGWLRVASGDDVRAVADRVHALLCEGPHHAERILLLGVQGGLSVRISPGAPDVGAARELLRLARASPPTTWFQCWPLLSAFDTLLAEHTQRPCPSELVEALGVLRTFARMAPVGRAAACLAEGDLHAARGRSGRARRAWSRARVEAERVGLAAEQARASERLGDGGGLAALRRAATAARALAPVDDELAAERVSEAGKR